jgi:hypothetical protein
MTPSKLEAVLKRKLGAAYRKARGKNGIEFKICCPFCLKRYGKPDKGYKLSLNPEMNAAHCFRCDYSGPVSGIFKIKNDNTPSAKRVEFVNFKSEPPGELVRISELPDDHRCCNYLRGRGFSVDALDRYFGVMYCSQGRKYAGGIYDTTNTVIFPVWMHGKLAGWQSRLMYNPDTLTEAECAAMGFMKDEEGQFIRPPKYFTDPVMRKGECLYNFDLARQSELVVVCEGTMDAMSVGPCGVATFGKGVTEMQARIIQNNWKLAAILLDPGDAEEEMEKLKAHLRCIPSFVVDLKGYKDAGEAPSLEIWRQIYDSAAKAGFNLLEYKLNVKPDSLKP